MHVEPIIENLAKILEISTKLFFFFEGNTPQKMEGKMFSTLMYIKVAYLTSNNPRKLVLKAWVLMSS